MILRRAAAVIAVTLLASPAAGAARSQQAEPKATARISGRVVAAETGRPIRGAIVRLGTSERTGASRSVQTDAQGRFQFTDLPPARYQVEVRADRFVPMQLGGRPVDSRVAVPPTSIDLREGELFDKADFALPRTSAIEGRVLDEFGDPAPGILVQVSRMEFAGGRRRLVPVASRARIQPTDDKGHFRIWGLAPAEYFVAALSGAFAEQNETGGFAPTYFPGTPDPTQAGRVRVRIGQEVTNLTIPMVPARTVTVEGVVQNADGQPAGAGMTLSVADHLQTPGFLITRGQAGANGSFTFRNVPPGVYTIQAFGRPPEDGPLNLAAGAFGWLPISVAGDDLSGLVVKLSNGTRATGRIVLEDPAGPPLKPAEVSVGAMPTAFDSAPVAGGPSPSSMKDDWSFEVRSLSGMRVLRASVRSPAWTVKRVLRNGEDVTDLPLDFREKDVGDLEVVLTTRVSNVSAAVTDEKGNKVTSCSVVIFASDSSRWRLWSRHVVQARPSQDGSYSIRGLPPDDYFAIALPALEGTIWQDPEFLESLRSSAERFTLSEGEARTLNLPLKPLPQ